MSRADGNADLSKRLDGEMDITKSDSRMSASRLAQAGALFSAILASACCWLPLLLIAFGVSGGALSATFEAYRPVLLPVTFLLLGVAFYFTYRKPKASVIAAGASGNTDADAESCCAVPSQDEETAACCPPESAKGFTLKKMNKIMLWAVTAFVLAFAFFPNYVGALLGGGDSLAARKDVTILASRIDGMTCEACSVSINSAVESVPGVTEAEVNFERAEALIGVLQDTKPPRSAVLAAISGAGFSAYFTDQTQWNLRIDGMTCQGCASHIQATLLEVSGVHSASVDSENGHGLVIAGATVQKEDLAQAVKNAGYTLTEIKRSKVSKD